MPEVPYHTEAEQKEKTLQELQQLSDVVISEYDLELNDVDQFTLNVDLGILNSAEQFLQAAQNAINLGLTGIAIDWLEDDSASVEEALHQKATVVWNPKDFKVNL